MELFAKITACDVAHVSLLLTLNRSHIYPYKDMGNNNINNNKSNNDI